MTLITLTMQEYNNLRNEDAGLCKKCKALSYGVEPDARGYHCDSCQARAVYGIEECVFMGLIDFKEDEK